jgi:hypothetical protein
MCLCPVAVVDDVSGTFRLTPAQVDPPDPWFQTFDVTDLSWTIMQGDTAIPVTGSGTYRVGGDFALTHQLVLDVTVGGQGVQRFDSGVVLGGDEFPSIDIVISLNGLAGCYDEWFEVRARLSCALTAPVRYELLDGSTLVDDCPVCGRPSIIWPLTGTFDLALQQPSLQTDFYDVLNIDFETPGGMRVSGSGTLRVGIGPSAAQVMDLTVEIDGESGIPLHGEALAPSVGFPALDLSLDEVTTSHLRVYRLRLVAAPRPTAAVPTLSEWGLSTIAFSLAVSGVWLIRRRGVVTTLADGRPSS